MPSNQQFYRDLFHRAPVFIRRWTVFVVILLYATLVELIVNGLLVRFVIPEGSFIAVVNGLVFSLLLAFRTNTAYDRWWEGRKLWGQLVNDCRNLTLKARGLIQVEPRELKQFAHKLIDFAEALKNHLRLPARRMPEHGDRVRHEPMRLAGEVFAQLSDWQRQGKLSETQLLLFDPHCRSLMDICGACERIRTTPLSPSYRLFLRQGIALYLLTLPWFIARSFGWWSLLICLIATYFMVGVELIAEDVEEPFGLGGDDLKLDDICLTIGHSIRQLTHLEAARAGSA